MSFVLFLLLIDSYPSFVDVALQDFCSPTANNRNATGAGYVHYAASFGKLSYLEYYVDEGVQIDQPDHTGATPLLYAAWSDKLNTFEYLMQQGCNVNAQDNGMLLDFLLSSFSSFY
jgi:ankyrin repeat protein